MLYNNILKNLTKAIDGLSAANNKRPDVWYFFYFCGNKEGNGGEQVLIIILVVRQRFIMRHTIDPPSGGERADPLTGPKRWGQQVTTEGPRDHRRAMELARQNFK